MKINKNCKQCNVLFLADTRELNRGNAKFCSITCGISYNNTKREQNSNNLICKHYANTFKSSSLIAKYCSQSCKLKNYRIKKKSGNIYDRQLETLIKEYSCEICGWNLASRDAHHIIHVSKGGKSIIENLISVCPNHHRMIHSNLLSQDYLCQIAKSRTISSSLESLLIKIKSKEQDANSGN